MNQLTPIEEKEITNINDVRRNLQNFTSLVSREPDKSELKRNTYAQNAEYLPISFVETTLDEVFFGLWEVTNFTYQVVGNEIIGSLELRVFHPSCHVWLTRSGAGAAQIQLESGAKPSELDKKKADACTKALPKLKAECMKNAAKSLGKLFGRDLNRKHVDTYEPIIGQKPASSLDREAQS